ncbi:hypothetical protein PU646_10415 [Klebsiella pneumoniae]|uniref:Uncharacterized protein n=1 Tax=Klebsiella pneumoniae TaxID=573 RepID=A0AAW8ABH0_KLEPN|nr:hypothetical protein [Klebsiella pneumoniae]MBX4637835.1 hypothetical protein [Klebsiella pneumoniae]MBX4764324.1 hypothetical protein [Klebsiella pneumoniae]MDP0966020.1 hypothetical protein [Klebsiella pneumoniae]MDZ1369696.1 hypothetical protein [Klebsiella pneumoniae]MEA4233258.1 hypothetical protein [Klebsiella pneumoniae]
MKIQFQTNNGFPLLTVADERVLDFLNVSALCRFLKVPRSSFMIDVEQNGIEKAISEALLKMRKKKA